MAARESDFHRELIKGLNGIGSHSFKASDRSKAGVPDVYSCVPDFGSWWIECKFEIMPKMQKTLININLSELQSRFIKNEIKSGGNAGWAVCVKMNRTWFYYVGVDWRARQISQDKYVFHRKAGQELDVKVLMNALQVELHEFRLAEDFPFSLPQNPQHGSLLRNLRNQ